MRIAVSGTHAIGKSTLVEELGAHLPDHRIVPEPYELLVEHGHMFEHPPSVEDFVAQLQASITVLRNPSPDLILERSPLDFLAYIYASAGADRFDITRWREGIAQSLASLDLIVNLRLDPTDDPGGMVDDPTVRLTVDDWLRANVDDDLFELCEVVDILVLDGPWHHRLDRVLAYLEAMQIQ